MSSGISALCRTYPRLALGHIGRAAARSLASRPRPLASQRPRSPTTLSPYSTSNAVAKKPTVEGKPEDALRRNQQYRRAYRNPPADLVQKELKGAFVHNARQYQSPEMTALSEKECLREARRLAGNEVVLKMHLGENHFLLRTLGWEHIHTLLKKMTPRSIKDDDRVSAMRVVISNTPLQSGSLGQKVNFISSVTGILEKLRVDPDANPSMFERQSFIIRGGRRLLAQAADELSQEHPGIEIFELGDVATTDYHTQQLWPTLDALPAEDQDAIQKSKRDRLWLHPEPEPQWITTRFSDIPKPKKGDPHAFEAYVTELVSSRIRRDLVVDLYNDGVRNGSGRTDIEADRARLLLEAFEDPENKDCITNASLKRALAHLSKFDGYRKDAKRIFRLAESVGLPMDTEDYNIMLGGLVAGSDFRGFYKLVSKMKSREFEPNARTWLLFLRLVKKDDERRQIVSSMFERNLLTHQSVRRGVAAVTAPMDAYQAFRAGRSLQDFISEHNERFGNRWYTREALIGILKQYFRYFGHKPISAVEWTYLVDQRFECGERMDTGSMNTVVALCAENNDWVGTIWCIDYMTTHSISLDDKTYMTLLRLCCQTSNYYAFTAIIFHGVHNNCLYYGARTLFKAVTLSKDERNPWRDFNIPLFTKAMAETLDPRNRISQEHLASQVFDLYRQFENSLGLIPAEPLTMSLLTSLSLHHEAMALKFRGSSRAPPVLEIPMKKRGEINGDVVETYNFDTSLVLGQAKPQLPEPERQEPEKLEAEEPEEKTQAALPVETNGDPEDAPSGSGLDQYNWKEIDSGRELTEPDGEDASNLQDQRPQAANTPRPAEPSNTQWSQTPATGATPKVGPHSRFHRTLLNQAALKIAVPQSQAPKGSSKGETPPTNWEPYLRHDPRQIRQISTEEDELLERIRSKYT